MTNTTQTVATTRENLVEQSINQNEACIASNGALVTRTGKRTGRSTGDRFIVQDEKTISTVNWGKINQPMKPEQFEHLWNKAKRLSLIHI